MPPVGADWPAAQDVQGAPGVVDTDPAGQYVQAVPPTGADWPAGQFVQTPAPAPANLAAGQAVQLVSTLSWIAHWPVSVYDDPSLM